jgi:hypothetical protein
MDPITELDPIDVNFDDLFELVAVDATVHEAEEAMYATFGA